MLERIREELLDYRGTGMSVMEMSHRSAEFEEIIARAEQNLRKLMGIPEEYGGDFRAGRRERAVRDGADESLLAGEAGGRVAHGNVDREGADGIEARDALPAGGFDGGGEIYATAAEG